MTDNDNVEICFLLTSRLLSNLCQSFHDIFKIWTPLLRFFWYVPLSTPLLRFLAWYSCILSSPNSHTKHFSFLHRPFQSLQKAAFPLLFCCWNNTISHFRLASFLPIHHKFRIYVSLKFSSTTAFLVWFLTPHHPVLPIFFSLLFLLDAFVFFLYYAHFHSISYAWRSIANYNIFSFPLCLLLMLFWYLFFYWDTVDI